MYNAHTFMRINYFEVVKCTHVNIAFSNAFAVDEVSHLGPLHDPRLL